MAHSSWPVDVRHVCPSKWMRSKLGLTLIPDYLCQSNPETGKNWQRKGDYLTVAGIDWERVHTPAHRHAHWCTYALCNTLTHGKMHKCGRGHPSSFVHSWKCWCESWGITAMTSGCDILPPQLGFHNSIPHYRSLPSIYLLYQPSETLVNILHHCAEPHDR